MHLGPFHQMNSQLTFQLVKSDSKYVLKRELSDDLWLDGLRCVNGNISWFCNYSKSKTSVVGLQLAVRKHCSVTYSKHVKFPFNSLNNSRNFFSVSAWRYQVICASFTSLPKYEISQQENSSVDLSWFHDTTRHWEEFFLPAIVRGNRNNKWNSQWTS
jgi:hypothetical protein